MTTKMNKIIELPPPFSCISEALDLIEAPNGAQCLKLFTDHQALIAKAPGSKYNHQAWKGGYYDHVIESMSVARLDYMVYASTGREMPFTLSDALLVLFLHDAEKPWKYACDEHEEPYYRHELSTKKQREAFRLTLIKDYKIALTDAQQNALKYAEGENDDYRGDVRVMNELAAFVHRCDVWSARLFHNHPLEHDPWEYSHRSKFH